MTRRNFLKGLGAVLATVATAPQIEFIASKFTDSQIEEMDTLPSLATFQELLNAYLPTELLREAMTERNYLLSRIDRDDTWTGGLLFVPILSPSFDEPV